MTANSSLRLMWSCDVARSKKPRAGISWSRTAPQPVAHASVSRCIAVGASQRERPIPRVDLRADHHRRSRTAGDVNRVRPREAPREDKRERR